jgi:DnaK suppressor protein
MKAVDDHTELQQVLEEQFEVHTGRLAELVMCGGRSGAERPEGDGVGVSAASARRELADIAHALRRMAEGSYGTCEHCGGTIAVERLNRHPQARYCTRCESSSPDPPASLRTFDDPEEVSRAERS